MKKQETIQLSEIMRVLCNINDNLRIVIEQNEKLLLKSNDYPSTIKHLVVIKENNNKKSKE
jgi:hypothetical protein